MKLEGVVSGVEDGWKKQKDQWVRSFTITVKCVAPHGVDGVPFKKCDLEVFE